MDTKQLLHWVNLPQTHRKIVGEYQGCYALGVTDNPPAFVLRVEPDDVDQFPDKVSIRGIEVPVIVHGGFEPPRPQRARV
jgi:hypothetical protein